MENLLLSEIKKELNWKEKIIVTFFKRISIKIYKIGIEKGVNAIL